MLDKAIALWPQLEAFLQQGIFETRRLGRFPPGTGADFPAGVTQVEGEGHGAEQRVINAERSG
ncbi:hypothetical protein AB6H18_19015 [Enterobacter hormaechei]